MRRNVRTGVVAVVAAIVLGACALGNDALEAEPEAQGTTAAPVVDVEPEGDVPDPTETNGPDDAGSSVEPGTGTDDDAVLATCAQLPGSEPLDAEEVTDQLLATLAAPDGATRADADLNPLTKAVLLVEAQEPALPHVRYRVRSASSAGTDGTATDLVRVDRFNLGPAIRDELSAQDGVAVAPPEEFGVGPHVAYCVEMRPLQALTADVVAVARAELADDAPASGTCLGVGCGDPASVPEAAITWQDGDELHLPATAYDALRHGAPGPAVALDLALVELGLATRDGDAIRWQGPEPREGLDEGEPFIEAVIDVGLGQDLGVDLAVREGALMDDALAAVWQRILGVATGDPDRPQLRTASAVEERRAG